MHRKMSLMLNDTELPAFNSNLSEDVPLYDFGPEYHQTVRLYTLGIMFVMSLLGNSMVVKQLVPLRRGRFPKSKILFLNLAVSDLFVTFATMLSQFIWELMDHQWVAGDACCKLFKFLQTYSLCSSTYMLVAIALDRFNAIVRPFASSPQPQACALVAWGAALIPALPCFAVFHRVQVAEGLDRCVSKFYTSPQAQFWRQTYIMFVFLTAFIFPFALLFLFYVRIMVEIRQRAGVFSAAQQTGSSLPRARIKTLRVTSAILLVFLVLNAPYVAYECFISFGGNELLDRNVAALAGVISASNSAFNPYIFLAFQSQRTSCFRRLLRQSRRLWSGREAATAMSFAVTSKTSSRLDVGNQMVNAREPPVANGTERKVEATFV